MIFSLFLFLPLCFPRRHSKARDSDDENGPDDEDAVASAVGCLGPLSGLLAPELQKYQKQIKGKEGPCSDPDRVGSIRLLGSTGSLGLLLI